MMIPEIKEALNVISDGCDKADNAVNNSRYDEYTEEDLDDIVEGIEEMESGYWTITGLDHPDCELDELITENLKNIADSLLNMTNLLDKITENEKDVSQFFCLLSEEIGTIALCSATIEDNISESTSCLDVKGFEAEQEADEPPTQIRKFLQDYKISDILQALMDMTEGYNSRLYQDLHNDAKWHRKPFLENEEEGKHHPYVVEIE